MPDSKFHSQCFGLYLYLWNRFRVMSHSIHSSPRIREIALIFSLQLTLPFKPMETFNTNSKGKNQFECQQTKEFYPWRRNIARNGSWMGRIWNLSSWKMANDWFNEASKYFWYLAKILITHTSKGTCTHMHASGHYTQNHTVHLLQSLGTEPWYPIFQAGALIWRPISIFPWAWWLDEYYIFLLKIKNWWALGYVSYFWKSDNTLKSLSRT